MQLAPVALQNRQQCHSSEAAPEEGVADRYDSTDPLGEAAAEADPSGVAEHHETQPAVSVDPLPVMLAGAPRNGGQAAVLLHAPKLVVSKLPVKSASLKRSASFPSGVATLPAAAAGLSIPEVPVPPGKPNSDISLAHSNNKQGSLDEAEGHSAKGYLAAVEPISSMRMSERGLQPAYSLPLVHAAVLVAPSLPTVASASTSAAAAADSVLHHSLRKNAASNLSHSAFKPYNGSSLGMSSHGAAVAANTNSQNRLGDVSGSAVGKYDHMGVNNQGSNCKAPMADDKENLLPAETHDSKPTPQASKGPASTIGTGNIKVPFAVYKSTAGRAGQSVGGPSSADGHGPAGEECEGIQSGSHGASVGTHHTHLGQNGAESIEPRSVSASKRAKLTHGVD